MRASSRVRDHTPNGQRLASAAAYAVIGAACGSRGEGGGVKDALVDAAAALIGGHYAQADFSVAALAGCLRVHRCTLARRFQNKMGVPVVAYLRAVRIQKALSLLKDTGKPVAEIAAACGYDDPNYFCKLVKESTGLSPTEFRKNS